MLDWSWYRMTHCQVKGTGHGTIWYIVRWNTLVVVPHDTFKRYHDQCNLAMCHAVPQPVYFTWQCLIRYQNQCLSPGNGSCVPRPVQPGNVSYGTTTSVFHLAMCNAVQRPVPFTCQCHAVPRPVQPSNMSYCTTTSVFHLTMCHTVWYIVRWNTLFVVPHDTFSDERHCLWNRIAHCQVKYTGCGTA
jgi:hypothetical protein